MTRDRLTNQYFEWLCGLVTNSSRPLDLYSSLFSLLHSIDFQVRIGMDENRAADGIDLRYRFGEEFEYHQAMICSFLDIKPCSVLELMVALALRCEEDIMNNPDMENQIGKWFWMMLINLGLESMDDGHYDDLYCKEVIHRFLNRDYAANGSGGLFVIENCDQDLRHVEILYQMYWYLDSIIKF